MHDIDQGTIHRPDFFFGEGQAESSAFRVQSDADSFDQQQFHFAARHVSLFCSFFAFSSCPWQARLELSAMTENEKRPIIVT